MVQPRSISAPVCPSPAASFSGLCSHAEVVLAWAGQHFHSLKVSGDKKEARVSRMICLAALAYKQAEGGRFTFSKETRLGRLRLVLVHIHYQRGVWMITAEGLLLIMMMIMLKSHLSAFTSSTLVEKGGLILPIKWEDLKWLSYRSIES